MKQPGNRPTLGEGFAEHLQLLLKRSVVFFKTADCRPARFHGPTLMALHATDTQNFSCSANPPFTKVALALRTGRVLSAKIGYQHRWVADGNWSRRDPSRWSLIITGDETSQPKDFVKKFLSSATRVSKARAGSCQRSGKERGRSAFANQKGVASICRLEKTGWLPSWFREPIMAGQEEREREPRGKFLNFLGRGRLIFQERYFLHKSIFVKWLSKLLKGPRVSRVTR